MFDVWSQRDFPLDNHVAELPNPVKEWHAKAKGTLK
jgi:hypothetical protein